MKKIELEIPAALSVAEEIEYLKVSAEFWKNYFFDLENFANEKEKIERGGEGECST